jgi:hypothetical protein
MTAKDTEKLWKKLFVCDPESGVLTWQEGKKKGKRAGCYRDNGQGYTYRVVVYRDKKPDRKRWYEHRIVWTLVNGPIPEGHVIDHIDGNPSNNKLENLRCVTPSINSRNSKLAVNNTSGVCGVSWASSAEKWRAAIYKDKKYLSLGLYKTFEEAVAARKAAEKVLGYISR